MKTKQQQKLVDLINSVNPVSTALVLHSRKIATLLQSQGVDLKEAFNKKNCKKRTLPSIGEQVIKEEK